MSIITNLRKCLASLLYKNTISLPNEYLKYGNKRMTSDWTEVLMSDQDHYTGYGYASIRNRANAVAKLAIENVRVDSDNPDATHPYLELIKHSQSYSQHTFWRDISTYLDLEGVYYLMAIRAVGEGRVGNVQEFKMLNPYFIKRVLTPDRLSVAGYVEAKKGMVREIPKEMIIEIKELNPFDEDKPFAMTDAAKDSQFTLKTAGDYQRHAIKGNINAPGVLSTDVILPDTDFQNFVARVRNHTKGEPIFGNGAGGITWESMTQNLRDSALEVVNEMNRDQLFAVAGVSKTIMGIEQSGTTRETARVQKDLNIEGHCIPRVQLIIDALNLDYSRNNPSQKSLTIVVDNPNATDIDAEKKEAELEKIEFELYNSLIDKGYTSELASQYVMGEIGLDKLGEPTNKPIEPEVKPVDTEKLTQQLNAMQSQGIIAQQQGALQNAIVNIEGRTTALVINKLRKKYSKTSVNAIEDADEITEADIISKYDKKDLSNELALIIAMFYGIIFTLQGEKAMKDRAKEYGLPGDFKLNEDIKKYLKEVAEKASKGHIDTISKDLYDIVRKDAMSGKSLEEIVSNIKREYSDEITEQRAKTIARTETERAFTRSQYEADKQFIKQNKLEGRVYKQWVTRSGNPCAFCKELESRPPIPFNANFASLGDHLTVEGKELGIGFEDVQAGTLHPNCVLPDTRIISPDAKNIIKSYYLGDVIELMTIGGRTLSVTPNHIMLTTRGWVSAKNLRKTDSIISYGGWDEVSHLEIDPANNNSPATIEQIFATAIKNSPMMLRSVPVTPEHLKGDGAFSQGNIDIISVDSLLSGNHDTSIHKSLNNSLLCERDVASTIPLIKQGNLASMLIALGLTSDGIVGGDSLSNLFSRVNLSTEEFTSLFNSASYNSRLQKASGDNTSGDSETISELLFRFSSLITEDHIVDIKTTSYSGHVYDINSNSTLYINNGLITSNCACEYKIIIEPAKNYLEKKEQELEAEKKKVQIDLQDFQKEVTDILSKL